MNEWLAKYEKLEDRFEIEKWAATLSSDALVDVLNHIPFSPKIGPLLMGIGTANFRYILNFPSQKIETILTLEAHQEPVHLHQTLLNKIWEEELNELTAEQLSIMRKIHLLPLDSLVPDDINQCEKAIYALSKKAEKLIEEINQGLKLAWNSGRTDGISKISFLKDAAIKIHAQAIPSLQSFLKNRLESVFGPQQDEPGLNDSDSIQDGLARLGLWQLEDFYKENVPKDKFSNVEEIYAWLENAGLKTVKDLKTRAIYSKPLFNYWIAAFKALKT